MHILDLTPGPSRGLTVVFDLETIGLARSSDIIQIAANTEKAEFQNYVTQRVVITPEASAVTRMTYCKGTNQLYLNGKEVEGVSVQEALLDFITFL